MSDADRAAPPPTPSTVLPLWEAFEMALFERQREFEQRTGYQPPLLFRGHGDARWGLDTTLVD
jgi:hypothetical protein